MLKPTINISHQTELTLKQTLKQTLFSESIVTTLNDIIEKYNCTNLMPEIITNVNSNTLSNIDVKKNQLEFLYNVENNKENELNNTNEESSIYSTKLAETTYNEQSELNLINSELSVSDIASQNEILSETKFYWEYGNVKKLNKKMIKNMIIGFYIDKLFNEYNKNVVSCKYSELFNISSNKSVDLKSGKITTNKGIVTAILQHEKISGSFNIIETAHITLSDINITNKELKEKSIPNINSLLKHTDNIYHITKIIKLFDFDNKINIKSNLSNTNTNFKNITSNANNYINDLIINGKKQKILKTNKNFCYYIKVYNDHIKGFIIDNINNILHYFASSINIKTANTTLRYYIFNTKNGKIV
jgi:hypothetical protein